MVTSTRLPESAGLAAAGSTLARKPQKRARLATIETVGSCQCRVTAVCALHDSRESPCSSSQPVFPQPSHRPFDPMVPGGTRVERMERRRMERKSGLLSVVAGLRLCALAKVCGLLEPSQERRPKPLRLARRGSAAVRASGPGTL